MNRVPIGSSNGGQFAPTTRIEPDIVLASDSAWGVKEVMPGLRTVQRGGKRIEAQDRAMLSLHSVLRGRSDAGRRETQGLVDHARLGQGELTVVLSDSKGGVTIVTGTTSVDKEGNAVVHHASGDYSTKDHHLIALAHGSIGDEHAQEMMSNIQESIPVTLDPMNLDFISRYSEGAQESVEAVIVFNHPGFTDNADGRGSVFAVTSVQPGMGLDGEDAVNGYALYTSESTMESMPSSMSVFDLENGGLVRHFQPGSVTLEQLHEMGRAVHRRPVDDLPDRREPWWDLIADARIS